MKPTGYAEFMAQLFGKPSVTGSHRCAVCGSLWPQKHHVLQKGAGGVTPEVDARIPLVNLCHRCHAMVHDRKTLVLWWVDGLGGWAYWCSPVPIDTQLAVTRHIREFRPLPGWVEQRMWADVIGRGR